MSDHDVKVIRNTGKTPDSSRKRNNTIYINNLNERIPISELKEGLNRFFSKFGVISSIKCLNSFYRRGQAWISFENVDSAEVAIKNGKNASIFGKPMRVNFSIENSRIYPKEKSNNEIPMVPRSVKSRIELYKLYLDQWLKHVKTHKLIDVLGDSGGKQSHEAKSSNNWDSSYMYTSKKHSFEKLQLISKQCLTGATCEPHFFELLHTKHSSLDTSETNGQNTTILVQIISGKCKEEDMRNIFQSICGFKELRYVPVS
ncbi:U1 snrnp [Cryptosporidium bovis]|uniref:U1 snrnp n=1 Tax=Cryptosporidium bovis TaxID=310047 RepID=UPI00351A5CDB|nr:U1 snrnp [Cryptosporidium bovis]